jgi:Ricin-type beta-trefoil lectin domain
MMQRSRRIAVYAVVTGLLTAGTLTATSSAAHANVAGFCNGSGAAATCTVTETITAPTSVTVSARATVNGLATVSWTASCALNGQTTASSGGSSSESPATDSVTLPVANPASCTVSATISLPTSDSTNTLSVAMTYTTGASPSPSPTPSTVAGLPVKGYAGKCLDDAGNSSANAAKIQIWTCRGDKAQAWTYSSGELIHNGKCLNDQAWGGNRTKQILYTCNRALNELWTHLANGEYVLNAHGYTLCLDDPAYSTADGTQLIVYTCKDSSNQRWSVP